uniref:U1 small nuclear ribonucleoprotein A n=1 Tax=Homo sapiens TaxID=9606 RepID=UPI0000D834F0|nr:Chain A, U1 small nuclear ribonucleoprotein A [Homo sapiens]
MKETAAAKFERQHMDSPDLGSTPPHTEPSQVVLITNINPEVPKEKLQALLYALASSQGDILDIVVDLSDDNSGKAYIVFATQESAQAFVEAFQGYPFQGNPLVITFSETPQSQVAEDGSLEHHHHHH